MIVPTITRKTFIKVAFIAVFIVILTTIILTFVSIFFEAQWPQDTATRSKAENWFTLLTLMLLFNTSLIVCIVSVSRAQKLQWLHRGAVSFFGILAILWAWFMTGILWPTKLSLQTGTRLQVIQIFLFAAMILMIIPLLASPDPQLADKWVILKRLILLMIAIPFVFFLVWALGKFIQY